MNYVYNFKLLKHTFIQIDLNLNKIEINLCSI